MTAETDTRRWAASAIQSGTNDRMWAEGATKEECDLQLFGIAYAAKASSVVYYRVGPVAESAEVKP